MFTSFRALAAAGAIVGACLGASVAQAGAGWIVALVDGKTLVTIDPTSRKTVGKVDVRGAGPLLGIDVRPADGMLYGLVGDGSIVAIELKTGQATVKSRLSEPWKAGVPTTVDFNPAADRLRVMGADGASLRVSVEDGKAIVDGTHRYKDGDANAGKTPRIVAAAYTNAMKGSKETTLYNIDAATGALVSQVPPNDGLLNTIGPLGVNISGPAAFNIVAVGEGRNEAWLVTGGALYAVDLKRGKATLAGNIEGLPGNPTDIAWID